MAAPDEDKVYRVPGKLVLGASDYSAAYPYGGTELGESIGYELRPGLEVWDVPAQEWGQGAVVDLGYEQGDPEVGLVMEQMWDGDWLSTIFPDTSGSGADTVVDLGPAERSGLLVAGSGNAVHLTLVANDVDTHPSVVLYQAMPVLAVERPIRFGAAVKMVQAARFRGLRDQSKTPTKAGQMGILSNLTV